MIGFKRVLISLGSNLGDRAGNIKRAIRLLSSLPFKVEAVSSLYENPPVGFESKNLFLNAVLVGRTPLSPFALLAEVKKIEAFFGRRVAKRFLFYEDREIDLDIIFYEDQVIKTPSLMIPHPLAHLRAFVLKPACEIDPFWVHPILKEPLEQLYQRLKKFNNLPPMIKRGKISL
jgi:2-amino-4-hydroxy-6-hydroxymethyldihydropteridine diphosphokinase